MDKKPTLRNPQSFINGLEKTNEFLGHLAKGKSRPVSIGHAATILHERMESREVHTTESKLDSFGVKIIAELPRFIEAQRALDKIRADRKKGHIVSSLVSTAHVRAILPYNHALRDLIDWFPEASPDNVGLFVFAAARDINGPVDADYCRNETRNVLHGMQHEVGLEHILWQIEDVEDVQHATEEQELEGIDLVVTYHGQTICLDAKATEFGESNALSERAAYMQSRGLAEASMDDGYPIWTGLDEADFKGGFRIDDATAKAHAPEIQEILDDILKKKSLAS